MTSRKPRGALTTWASGLHVLLVMGLCPLLALAQKPAPRVRASASASAPSPSEHRKPSPFVEGPRTIELGPGLTLELPEGHAFLPPEPAAAWAQAMCTCKRYSEKMLGLVVVDGHHRDWFVAIRYDEEGYVRDDEEIDADATIASVRESAEGALRDRGVPTVGWSHPPSYDRALHQLVWSLRIETQSHAGHPSWSDDYNALLLGRRGIVSLKIGGFLGPLSMPDAKASANALLAATKLGPGSRYEDFDARTDRVAELRLAGLLPNGVARSAPRVAHTGAMGKLVDVIVKNRLHVAGLVAAGLIAAGALLRRLLGKRVGKAG